MSEINLKKIFYGLQKQMIDKLSLNREIISHPTTKGDASELNWIEWLRAYLPKRYCVDKAIIIDSNNKFSDQIDVVIYDQQYSPFIFNQDNVIYIPAESVYAVFEVKQELNKEYMEYAGAKVKSVRLLNRTSATIYHAGGKIDKPKEPFEIIGGVLTLVCNWQDCFGKPFLDILNSFDNYQRIDIGCALSSGSFSIDYSTNSLSIEKSTKEEALIYFFLKLLIRLQQLGTVTALDISSYARVLDSL